MEIKVAKVRLVDILRKNRAEHGQQYWDANRVYREVVAAELNRLLLRVSMGLSVQAHLTLPDSPPVFHDDDYARAIAMISMSSDKDIFLDETDFEQFVENKWPWSFRFSSSCSNYSSSSSVSSSSREKKHDI